MDSPVNASISTNLSKPTPSPQKLPITAFTRNTYISIASLAFLGNALVILVFVQKRALLKKSYNVLIFSLAISDIAISLNLISSPAFIFGEAFPYPSDHLLSEIFCRFIWTRAILFQLVVFSVYVCVALTLERWYAIVKPLKYARVFSGRRVLVYIACAWLISVLTCMSSTLEVVYLPMKPPSQRCSWKITEGNLRSVIGVIQVLLKLVLPILAMVGLCAHMLVKTQQSNAASAESRAKLRGRITRMVGGACLAMAICWTPNQVNYLLAVSGMARLDSPLHHYLTLLTFLNSCLNPLIYGFSNKNFRQGYAKVLSCCIPQRARSSNNSVGIGESSRCHAEESQSAAQRRMQMQRMNSNID